MWIADNWVDYEVLDTADGEKLERWGDYLLVRPDPQVILVNAISGSFFISSNVISALGSEGSLKQSHILQRALHL